MPTRGDGDDDMFGQAAMTVLPGESGDYSDVIWKVASGNGHCWKLIGGNLRRDVHDCCSTARARRFDPASSVAIQQSTLGNPPEQAASRRERW